MEVETDIKNTLILTMFYAWFNVRIYVPVPSEISDFCEISDLLLFFSYFASQNKEIKSGNYFFNVWCVI